jgi:spermidine synthase
VYAWGAAGSIVGTFFTGYYLIAKLGTVATFLAVGVGLCLVGIVYCLSLLWSSTRPREALIAFFAVFWALGVPVVAFYGLLEYWGVFEGKAWRFEWVNRGGETVLRERADPEQDILYLDESQYSFIKIDRNKVENEGETKETQRDLVLDNLIHAHYVPGDPTKLEYEYEAIYKAITHRCQPTGEEQGKLKALFIGGGGYVFPRYLRAVWPECYVEIAEIDPAVTRADLIAFGLDKTETQIVKSPDDLKRGGNPFWIYHLDARNHVEDLIRRKDTGETVPEFDFIYGDAFNDYAVPFHLTTREFNEKVKRLLKPESGVYLINIIDVFDVRNPAEDKEATKNPTGLFLGAVFNTFRETFGEDKTYVFCCNKDEPSHGRDTYIVVGSLRPLSVDDLPGSEEPYIFEGSQLSPEHLRILTDDRHSGADLLTDDKAPVENLLRFVVNSRKW